MIQCADCSKKKVCKFQDEYNAAVELVNDMCFDFPVKVQVTCEEYQINTGTLRTIPMPFEPNSEKWVKPEEVTCGQTFTWNSDDFTSD